MIVLATDQISMMVLVAISKKRRFFSSEDVSALFGFTYALNEKYLFKFERDTTLTPGRVGFDSPKSSIVSSLDLNVNPNLTLEFLWKETISFL